MREIQTTLVVGAGTMGHGFAQVLAMNKFPVCLVDETDPLLKRGQSWIADNLNYMIELKEIKKSQIKSTLDRIQFTTDLRQAAQEVDYVLEAVPENLDLKKKIFQELDAYTRPNAILASNTSSFDINEFSAVMIRPERVIGSHWYPPPQISPYVEVIPANFTSQETVDITMDFLKRISNVPTRCKSAPGVRGQSNPIRHGC